MKRFITISLLLFLLGLVGCTKGEPVVTGAPQDHTPTNSKATEQILADEQVVIRIDKGQAFLAFDLGPWVDTPGLFNASMPKDEGVNLKDVFFPVNGLSGKVISACSGEMPELLAGTEYEGLAAPVVVFLLEDGSLEWLIIDPYWHDMAAELGYDDVIYSWGKIPWLKDIVALSYESTKEGVGDEQTIYATDRAGLRYDIQYPIRFEKLTYFTWRYPLIVDDEDDTYYAYLDFDEAGQVSLEKAWEQGDMAEIYEGTYELYLAEDGAQGWRAGSIGFDLDLMWWIYEGETGYPEKISGVYFAEVTSDYVLSLWLAEGEALDTRGETKKDYYRFVIADMPGGSVDTSVMNDHELVDYMLSVVPDAQRLVQEQGMAVRVTGDMTELPDHGMCRDVWLGTDSTDAFVHELQYTISPHGVVHQYDPVGDAWLDVTFYV